MAWGFLEKVLRGNEKPRGGVFGVLRDVGEGIANPIYKTANEAAALSQILRGDIKGARRTLTSGGLGHQGGVLGGEELSGEAVLFDKKNLKKVLGTGLSIGSSIVAPMSRFGAKTLSGKVVKGALFGAPIGTVGGGGAQLGEGQDLNTRKLLEATVGGALLGAGGPLLGAGARRLRRANETGSINLNKLSEAKTPQEVQRISKAIPDDQAQAIALTPDPNIINNVITGRRPLPPQVLPETPLVPTNRGVDITGQLTLPKPPSRVQKGFLSVRGELSRSG